MTPRPLGSESPVARPIPKSPEACTLGSSPAAAPRDDGQQQGVSDAGSTPRGPGFHMLRRARPACCRAAGGGSRRRARAALRADRRSGRARSDRHHDLHHAQPRLPGLGHALRPRRAGPSAAADGRGPRRRGGWPPRHHPPAPRPPLPRRRAGPRAGLRGVDPAVGGARPARPDAAVLDRRAGGAGRPDGAVPPAPTFPDAVRRTGQDLAAGLLRHAERLARTDPAQPVREAVGSGRFRFLADVRVSGARVAYARFEGYLPRPDGAASGTAGPKVAHFEQIEWRTIPDPATAAAALQGGEVDWWEFPTPDLLPRLRWHAGLVVENPDPFGFIGVLRCNHLHPPFDDPAARRALLPAVVQADYRTAVAGTERGAWRDGVGFFHTDPQRSAQGALRGRAGAGRPPSGRRACLAPARGRGVAGLRGARRRRAQVPPRQPPGRNAAPGARHGHQDPLGLLTDAPADEARTRPRPLERPELARPAPPRDLVPDRLRLPAALRLGGE